MAKTLHVVMKIAPESETAKPVGEGEQAPTPKVRLDFEVLGDLRPDGFPEWKPGDTETGPNYQASVVLEGTLPEGELNQDWVTSVGVEIRDVMKSKLRRVLA